MEHLTCQMQNTGDTHPTIPGLYRYKCDRDDCQRTFWSYTDNIKINCRHKRGVLESVVAKTKQLFVPNRQSRRAAASRKKQPAKQQPQVGITPPTMTQKLWNVSQSLADWAAAPGNVTKEAYEARLQTCGACPYLQDTSCGICGCYIAVKAKATAWHCPTFRWEGDIGTSQVRCIVPLRSEADRQDLVMLMQSTQASSRMVVLDCLGDYVPFAEEHVHHVTDVYAGLRSVCSDPAYAAYAYIIMSPRVRGANMLAGLLWAQQLAEAGIVMPVYSATKIKITAADKKKAGMHWRNTPTISSDVFLLTAATIEKLGLPDALDDFAWSLQLYSLRARMAGIPVVEAWTCVQQQDAARLMMPSAADRQRLVDFAGPFWDMLLSDPRVRLPDPPRSG